MSEYDKTKFYGKKKPTRDNNFGSRFFNSTSKSKTEADLYKDKDDKKDLRTAGVKQPTILIKTRDRDQEDRSVSPKRQTRDSESSAPPITIVTAPTETAVPPCVKHMSKSVKFIEDGVIFTEHLQDYLEENNDFLVVGVIGAQGVGKSTLLNLLAHNKVTEELKHAVFQDKSYEVPLDSQNDFNFLTENLSNLKVGDGDAESKHLIFEQQNMFTVENNVHATTGIDLFITQNRVIFLDCQPFLSPSILDELMKNENKRSSVVSEFLPIENSGEIQSLQLTAFLMSVCHVLIFMQDWFLDSNAIRFIQTAEMLKPTISNPEDEYVDYFPHLILMHNKAQMEDFTPARFKLMQQFYKATFRKTKMHLDSGLGLGSGRILSYLCPESCGDPINLYLIPEDDVTNSNLYKGHPPLEELIKKLRANILGSIRYPLTHVTLSEKNWLVYSAKVWDHVKKSSFFVEYTKLMP